MSIPEIVKLGNDVELLQKENAALRKQVALLVEGYQLSMASVRHELVKADGALLGLACACQAIFAALDQAGDAGALKAHLLSQHDRVAAWPQTPENVGFVAAMQAVLKSDTPAGTTEARTLLN